MLTEFRKKALTDIMPDPTKKIYLWDSKSPGLGLRVTPSGAKSFIFKYELQGRGVWLTLGRLGDLTIEQARQTAAEYRVAVKQGKDPAKAKAKGMTVAEAAARMMDEREPRLRSKTIKDYKSIIKNHIVPSLGRLQIAALSLADVAAFHAKGKDTPQQTNHALIVLSLICKHAEKWGERPLGSNPCQHQEKYPKNARHRYLSETELAAIGETLNNLEDRLGNTAIDALRLIMLTGARKGEILHLRWEQIDFDGRTLHFEPSEHKTGGTSIAKQIPLSEAAIELLKAQPRAGRYVFQGKSGEPLGELKTAWRVVREAANVPDVRIHDLRHTWGAMATSGGHALQVIGAVMGHRSPNTTARYAHVAPSPAAKAVEETSAKIAAALGGKRKNQ